MKQQRTCLNVERLEVREVLSAYSPWQIQHAYGFDQLGLNGSGQTIAIVIAADDPTIGFDLANFDQQLSIPAPPNFWRVATSQPPAPDPTGALEICVDVEWAHAIAPGANILLVETASDPISQFNGIDYARHCPGVVAVSMSWGFPEFAAETYYDGLFTTPLGHIGGSGLPGGVTFVAASGDSGSQHPAWPAFSPNVLAVGGTTLSLDNQGNWLDETGWSLSGGGISQIEPEPAYQYSVQGTGARTIPDVSCVADSVWVFGPSCLGVGWNQGAGTSVGAPQWAALVALADQYRAFAYGAGSLDGANDTLPAIYSPQMNQDFIDITTGKNGGYSAGPGYDLVTGIGSPWAPYVVSDLASVGFWGRSPQRQPPSAGLGGDAIASSNLNQYQADRGLATSAVDAAFAASSLSPAPMPLPPAAPLTLAPFGQAATGNFSESFGVGAEDSDAKGALSAPRTADGAALGRANSLQTGFAVERSLSQANWDALWAEAGDLESAANCLYGPGSK